MIERIGRWLNSASGRKAVTYFGLIVAAISTACLQIGGSWKDHPHWLDHVCGGFIFVGAIIAGFGKGLADRRLDPEIQGVVDKERREPNEDG